METVADIFRIDASDRREALYFEERCWSYADLAAACARRANHLLAARKPGPFHLGVLLDNVPEFVFWLGACALSGATLVALNPTRRGADLLRDILHTDCQAIVTDSTYREELRAFGEQLAVPVFDSGDPDCAATAPEVKVTSADRCCLIFTSGTGSAPKAVIYSHDRVMRNARMLVERQGIGSDDVSYVAMPLFHSSGLLMGLLPPLMARGKVALRRRFSASGFLPDVRRYGVTRFCYVGKPLAYILATEAKLGDADNTLRAAYGSEAADVDIEAFSRRFDCTVMDNYGSSEGCVTILRTPGTPRGSIGIGVSETIRVLNPETGEECPRARFDAQGVLLNGSEAIGEIVNLQGGVLFEGYWNNPEAERRRVRDGAYWSGDLGYRDAQGWFYFAGRDSEWLRVDGENLSAMQIEQVFVRHRAVSVAAAYAVPDPMVGDQLMVALQLVPGTRLDPAELRAFLDSQPDLGSKWRPRFVRLCGQLPTTSTNKVLKRALAREGWACADSVWWREGRSDVWRPFDDSDRAALEATFVARGRAHLLPRQV